MGRKKPLEEIQRTPAQQIEACLRDIADPTSSPGRKRRATEWLAYARKMQAAELGKVLADKLARERHFIRTRGL